MTSRREVLAGLGAVGVAGLAGCSALPFGDDGGSDSSSVSIPSDAIDPIEWPDSPFPVTVPTALANRHEARATELLDSVPYSPSVPNDAVTAELQSDRADAAELLREQTSDPWRIRALSSWRHRRQTAAAVRGSYRAASGEDDAASVTERRRAVREDLGSFAADHEYRASSPLEAVLAHRPIEALVRACRGHARPAPRYPSDPVARPFQAGDAVGNVELAEATLADARRLGETYHAARSESVSQWAALAEASDRLRFAVVGERATVRDFFDMEELPFDADLTGTPARVLFIEARTRAEFLTDAHAESRDRGEFATAIVEAGRALAAIEALRAAIDGIRDGGYQDEVTIDSVTQTAERARAAIRSVQEQQDRRLATEITRPVLREFDAVAAPVDRRRGNGSRVQGILSWVELYARAVPAATDFVSDRVS